MRRRDFLAALATTGPLAASLALSATGRTIIVPYGPGGLPDGLARVVARKLGDTGQVIVENKPGASGIIGAQYFISRPAVDGSTLFLVDNNTYAINAAVYPNLVYRPARDFMPVIQAIQGPMYLVVNAASGIKSVQELIAAAKAQPSRVMYGSPGSGTLHHLGMEQLAHLAGVKMTHVPYKGVTQATPALLAGDVSAMFAALTSVSAHVKAGTLRILAIGSAQRSALTPDVPTLAEAGIAGLEVGVNMGFAAHSGTPAAVIEQLNAEIGTVLKSPDVGAALQNYGVRIVGGSAAQFTSQLNADQESYRRLVRETNLKID
jgi:tripartite-type tricarboxylate transporter receptor subunit TctC